MLCSLALHVLACPKAFAMAMEGIATGLLPPRILSNHHATGLHPPRILSSIHVDLKSCCRICPVSRS